jgi:ubiquinone/menaquinone biosynthesis C-methylase UbiE
MQNNYDRIANYYDTLSRLVYFRAQVNAQVEQLAFIPANSSVLIAGGGTGWILEELAKIHQGLTITYIEISSKMLALSKKRATGGNTVKFIQSAIEDFAPEGLYDVVVTAFLFDNFPAEKAGLVFNQLDAFVAGGGRWLFCDFFYEKKTGKKWQLYLLKLMYFLFRRISDVEAKTLVQTEGYFINRGYMVLKQQYYYSGFIKAIVYLKKT